MSVAHRRHHQLAVVRRAPASSDGVLGSIGKQLESTPALPAPSSKNEQQTTTTATTTQQTPTSQRESNTPSNNEPTTTAPSTPPTTAQATPTTHTTPSTTSTTVVNTPSTTTSTTSTAVQQTQQTQPQQNANTTPAVNPNTTITRTGALPSSSPSTSATARARNSSSGSARGVGQTIGVIAGVIGGIAALCVIVGFIMRRLRKRRDRAAADALGNDFSASEFRKSAVMIPDSSSTHSSPRPPSVIERRIAAHNNTASGYGMGGLQPGGYGQQGGYFERSSFYENQYENQYAQQYIPPPHSPTSLDPFMSSPVISTPPPVASSPQYLPRPASPSGSFANQFAGGPTLSPGVYIPGTMQSQQDLIIDTNRMSTASSVLINPHDSVAFGSGPVEMNRQGSLHNVPGSPTTVAPAQGLETFLQREPEPEKHAKLVTPQNSQKHVSADFDTYDAYGGV